MDKELEECVNYVVNIVRKNEGCFNIDELIAKLNPIIENRMVAYSCIYTASKMGLIEEKGRKGEYHLVKKGVN